MFMESNVVLEVLVSGTQWTTRHKLVLARSLLAVYSLVSTNQEMNAPLSSSRWCPSFERTLELTNRDAC